MNPDHLVQSWDKKRKVYVIFDLRTNSEVGENPTPFKGIDEIEPIGYETPKASQSDPLAMYR